MKKIYILLATLITIGSLTSLSAYKIRDLGEEKAITDLLERCYVHGAFNELNPSAMTEAFHEDFAIFHTSGDELTRYEIEDWVKNT